MPCYIFSIDSDYPAAIKADGSTIVVIYNGQMFWNILSILRSSCEIDVSYFPFDNQTCTLAFSVWMYDDAEVNLTFNNVDNHGLGHHNTSEWTYQGMQCHKDIFLQVNTSEFTWIICDLHFKRQPNFYIYNVIVPCVMLLFIGSLAFCLPPHSGEKVSLSVTVFLALVIFLMAIMDVIPPGANMPLLG